MFLKTLTMRGFKSFASATKLELEPGVTCVVGPNGSGKSNVVDALAWVMGEQGAKNLRGGKMDDVIFAGTSSRQGLGRAEVSLTIDNTDGAIPIDYTEVTISRTLFKSGGSEYSVNGAPARLLDIQELLNDSGLGKEMHVIVGQGQLDAILHADPMERRGFIEEAAGVLKHRRRKDKAVRKLNGLQTNLDRLLDLRQELSRQLGPLGRQARAAAKAATVQAELRDSSARLLADDIVQAQAKLDAQSDIDSFAAMRRTAEAALAGAREEAALTERALNELEDQKGAVTRRSQQAEALAGRAQALKDRSTDRREYMTAPEETAHGSDSPDALRARAKRYEGELEEADEQVGIRQQELAHRELERERIETQLAQAQRVLDGQREQLNAQLKERANLENSRGVAEATLAKSREGLTEVRQTLTRLGTEIAEAEKRLRHAQGAAQSLEAGEAELDAVYESALETRQTIESGVERIRAENEETLAEIAQLDARIEALQLAVALDTDTRAVLDSGVTGVLGSVGETLTITPGHEASVAAMLGDLAYSISVSGSGVAAELLGQMESDIDLVIDTDDLCSGTGRTDEDEAAAEHGWTVLRDQVTSASAGVQSVLDTILLSAYEVATVDEAMELVRQHPTCTFVSVDGTVVTRQRVRRSGSAEARRQASRSALTEAQARRTELVSRSESQRAELAPLEDDLASAKERENRALSDLHESDAKIMAGAETISQAVAHLESLRARRQGNEQRTHEIAAQVVAAEEALESARRQLDSNSEASDIEPDPSAVNELQEELSQTSEMVMEARIALRTASDRVSFLRDRIAAMNRQAQQEELAQAEARRRSQRRAEMAAAAQRISEMAAEVADSVSAARADARSHLAELEDEHMKVRSAHNRQVERIRKAQSELEELRESQHAAQLARERYVLQLDELSRRAQVEVGLSVESIIEQFGPHLPVPVFGAEEDVPQETPYVRAEVEKTQRRAQKEIAKIGKVNPLALEEFDALKERHDYLEKQISDIEQSRRDLRGLIGEVDRHVEKVFSEAFADTSREFAQIFDRLFPGGQGELSLTDPGDMLNTGVEVMARPAGKKVRRLSLLSGGERSLVAVAMLVAIFKARPSPFYVMDEVEAALDDINLSRLLTVFRELQESSQLIVITHQKRTMEIADALYGVTMAADGVSKVISQRIARDHQSVTGL